METIKKLYKSSWFMPLLLLAFTALSFAQHSPYHSFSIQGRHSWRQAQTMTNVRNFARTDPNILNPRTNLLNGSASNIRRYEFPISQWLMAQAYNMFGEKITIARLVQFFFAIIAVFGIFYLVDLLTLNKFVALLTAVMFQYSPVFYYFSINPIPDILALASAIWYVYFIVNHRSTGKRMHLILASFALLIATLAKLPYLMVSIISIFYFSEDLMKGKFRSSSPWVFAIIQLLITAPALAWYAYVIGGWEGNPILTGQLNENVPRERYMELLYFQVTEMIPFNITHESAWGTMLVGFISMFFSLKKLAWVIPLILITIVYLLLELVPIDIQHDYYLLPFLIWMYVLVGSGLNVLAKIPYVKFLLPLFCIWAALQVPNRVNPWWGIEEAYLNPDIFIYADELKNVISNDEPCIILNDPTSYVFSYKIDKQAHVFSNDFLPAEWVEDMIKNYGVKFMYSDSEVINNDEKITPYLREMIFQGGSIKVFRLGLPEQNLSGKQTE